jgi:hypothetical protein
MGPYQRQAGSLAPQCANAAEYCYQAEGHCKCGTGRKRPAPAADRSCRAIFGFDAVLAEQGAKALDLIG